MRNSGNAKPLEYVLPDGTTLSVSDEGRGEGGGTGREEQRQRQALLLVSNVQQRRS